MEGGVDLIAEEEEETPQMTVEACLLVLGKNVDVSTNRSFLSFLSPFLVVTLSFHLYDSQLPPTPESSAHFI